MIQFIPITIQMWLITLLYTHFSKRIIGCGTLDEAIAYRKQFKSLRRGSVIIFFALNLLFCYGCYELSKLANHVPGGSIFFYGLDKVHFVVTAIGWTIMGFTLGGGFFSHREFNPISFMSIQEFFKTGYNRPFSLYLRGFEKDNYNPKYVTKSTSENIFSEKLFVDQISSFFQVYAVGKPKELTSPIGATRIYLDNEFWKNDVLSLMKCADSIFILINQRESCIWEIEQSSNMLEKVCYIVDNIEQYREVKQKVLNLIEFPDIDDRNISLPFCIRLTQGNSSDYDQTIYLNPFANTEKGYRSLITNYFKNKGIFGPSKDDKAEYVLYINSIPHGECFNNSFEIQFVNELQKYISIIYYTYDITLSNPSVYEIDNAFNNKSTLLKKMNESPYIIMSIDNRDTCFQLLRECIKFKNKAIFVVNDPFDYKYIRLKYSNTLELPPADDIDSSFILYYINDKVVIEKKQDFILAPIVYHNKINRRSPWQDIL